jgi:hypothetical protein
MLTVMILTLQDEGFALFKDVLGFTACVTQMCQVFQMMLSYWWVWSKKILIGNVEIEMQSSPPGLLFRVC